MPDTLLVFTRKTVEEIVETGGSQYWKLKPENAQRMTYLVCTRNAKDPHENAGPELHAAGFLVGRISKVVPTREEPGRFLVKFSEWAHIDMPDLWTHVRNPVHYVNLADLGIDPDALEFQPVQAMEKPRAFTTNGHGTSNGNGQKNGNGIGPLTIAQAKKGLAMAFGVGLDAIEITVHG